MKNTGKDLQRLIRDLTRVVSKRKKLEKQEATLKNKVMGSMKASGTRKLVEGEYLITRMLENTRETVDLRLMQEEDPELYETLLEKYGVSIHKKEHIRVNKGINSLKLNE